MGRKIRDRLMESPSMARVSSASTDSNYIPPTVPFDWEPALGRPAAAEREIVESPSLPLPPGRRPKDGFFLPIPRPAQASNLQNKEGGINASLRERRPFKLEYPGSSKKILFKRRKPRKSHVDTDAGSIFNPLCDHRFGSRVTKRVLMESQKSPSCFGQCLPAGRKAPVELDPLDDSDEDERFVTPPSTPGSSPQTRNSLVAGAGKQLQVPSSRFNMAAMLLSICSESDESDKGNEISDDNGDEAHISEHLTTPRVPVSSSCRSGRLQQARPGADEVTNMSDRRCIVADVNSEIAPPDRELRLRQTEGSSQSNFAWKSRDQIGARLDPLAAILTTKVQEHGKSESANARPENVSGEEEIGPRGSCSSLARNFSARNGNCSPSSPKFVWLGSIDKRTVLPDPAARNRPESLSMPRSSCGSSDYASITSCSLANPKAEGRGRPTLCSATPTAEKSPLRGDSFEERSEPNQPPATPPISNLPHSLLQDRARLHIATSKDFRIEDKRARSNSPPWLEELKTSSLWPNRAPMTSAQGDASNGDSGDKSGEDIEIYSSDSFQYRTPIAGSPKPSPNSPVICNSNASPKPATWVVSEEALKSPTLLKCELQRQQSHESPRRSFSLDQETTAVQGPSTAFEQINVTVPMVLPSAPDDPSPSSPVIGNANASPKPATWVVSAEALQSSTLLKCKLQRQQSHELPRSSFSLDEETTAVQSTSTDFGQISVTTPIVLPSAPDKNQVNTPDTGSHGENLSILLAGRLSEMSKFSNEVQGESKVGIESSGKSIGPIYIRRRGSTIITGKAVSRCGSDDESGEDSEKSSRGSSGYGTPRAGSPTPSLNSQIFCKFTASQEPEACVVSEEVVKPSSSFQSKLQRQLHSMGLQTKPLHGGNHSENSSKDSLVYGTSRAASPTEFMGSPVFCKFNFSLEPDKWVVSEVVKSSSLLK